MICDLINTLSGHEGNFHHIEFLPWGHSHILTSTHCPSIKFCHNIIYINYCIILQNTAIFGQVWVSKHALQGPRS